MPRSTLELDNTYTEVPDDEYYVTAEGLVRAVKAGELAGKGPSPLLLMVTGYAKLRRVVV